MMYTNSAPLNVTCTGWRRLIGSPKLQIIFHKRATKYRSLLWKMTYKDKGFYESSPRCNNNFAPVHVWRIQTLLHSTMHWVVCFCNVLQQTATHCNRLQQTATHCSTLQLTTIYCNTPLDYRSSSTFSHHTATRCNTLQHAATRCNRLQHFDTL